MDQIVIAVKSSDVKEMINANRLISEKVHYPLHLGVTEAGPLSVSLVKSSIGIGTLLLEGIGDTIRFSISGSPLREVYAAKHLLCSLGMLSAPDIVSCPTCARTCIDVETYANRVIEMTQTYNKSVRIAIMGCVVNGVGEGKNADIGIAGVPGGGAIFKKGVVIGTYPETSLFSEFEAVLEETLKEIS
jgi:(E)-4-hydroxy-3-methylbut-2-enyl-diphosphate synthase